VRPRARALLLDLDGTLLDTAPDMGAALNSLRAEHGLAPLAPERIRPQVSHGARALVRLGFGPRPAVDEELLRQRFLALYGASLAVGTRPFPGALDFLAELEAGRLPWGIVTNKPEALTRALLAALGILDRPGCLVGGDTLPERKPSPVPLRHAATLLGRAPGECIYVGDAERDIEAGRAAGMQTLIAAYGYLAAGEDTAPWGADGRIDELAGSRAYLALP
jgi:N-acetyl-D-muramate 6-phosphate phosphatase